MGNYYIWKRGKSSKKKINPHTPKQTNHKLPFRILVKLSVPGQCTILISEKVKQTIHTKKLVVGGRKGTV